MTSALDRWDPIPIDDLVALLDGVECRWWVAGGWAIDLHLGRVTRPHDDTDVVILRLQFMLDDVRDGEWVYRRDARVRRPLDAKGWGWEVLQPGIWLSTPTFRR